MKIDPNNYKESYLNWKASINKQIPDISERNSELILDYLSDMENGLNVASVSKKGFRSFARLCNLKQRVIFLTKVFEEIIIFIFN
jgi:hypothetical protein